MTKIYSNQDRTGADAIKAAQEIEWADASRGLIWFAKEHMKLHGVPYPEAFEVAKRLNPEWTRTYTRTKKEGE